MAIEGIIISHKISRVTAIRIENLFGAACIAVSVAILLGVAPAVSFASHGAQSGGGGVVHGGGLWPAVICMWLFFSGIIYLGRSRKEILSLHWLLLPPYPEPDWGLRDCVKVIALFHCCAYAFAYAMSPVGKGGALAGFMLAELVALVYIVVIMSLRGATLRRLRISVRSFRRNLPAGVLSYMSFYPVLLLLMLVSMILWRLVAPLVGMPPQAPSPAGITSLTDSSSPLAVRIMLAVFIVVVAPVVEEFFFRGLLYGALRRHTRWVGAAVLSGILFGVLHGDPMRMGVLALFGVLLAILRERSGGLMLPIIVHAINNGVMLLIYASAFI